MNRELFGRVLTVALLVVLVASLLATAYVAVESPQSIDTYSEFYLLGPEGKAEEYPTQLESGEFEDVIVGVTNHEGEATDYVVRVVDLNATNDSQLATTSRTLADGETWETNVSFSIEDPGRHRVQFQLYKDTASGEPDLTTRLWVNVSTAESTTREGLLSPQRITMGVTS